MKLKRIFMTGVLASSMLALAACGDDAEGKPAEETPVEEGKETEKEKDPVDPVQPVDPVEPEEDKFTLSDALTALNNFKLENYINSLIENYTGDNSYLLAKFTENNYNYNKNKELTSKYIEEGNYIFTLDDAFKGYGLIRETKDGNSEYFKNTYNSLIGNIDTSTKIGNNLYSYDKNEFMEIDEDDNIAIKLIESLISNNVLGTNLLKNFAPYAKNIDQYKDMIVPYLINNVKEVDGKEVIDVQSMIGDVEGKVSEKTAGIDAGQTLLSLAEPFLVDTTEVKDKTDLTEIHSKNPRGFIYLTLTTENDMSIELSVDKQLLAMVLEDYKGKTILKLLADAYTTDEENPLTEQDILDKFTTGKLGGVLALLNKALASTMGEGFDITKTIQYYATAEIQDDIIGLASMCDFNLSYAITEGTFATKVNFPVVITNEDPSKTQIMPLFAYISYANGELLALAGQDMSTAKADDKAIAGYKEAFGVAADNELLIRDFLGNNVYPMGYVTYLADATDENKSVLEVNAMIYDYKALITKTENGVDAEIQSMKLDDKGKPVKDETTGKYVFEKVGSLSYTNDETGTIFDAAYGYMDKNEQNEDVFTKVISLTYSNTVADGLAINAYFNDYEVSITNDSIYAVKPFVASTVEIAGYKVEIMNYDVFDIKFNTEDALIEANIFTYDEKPAADLKQDPTSTNNITVKEIENGFKYDQKVTTPFEEISDNLTITKTDSDDNSIYSVDFSHTRDDLSESEIKGKTISLSYDENLKKLDFDLSNNFYKYEIEENEKKIVDSVLNYDRRSVSLSYDKENNLVFELITTDDEGLLDRELSVTLEYADDADFKDEIISEIEENQDICDDYQFKFFDKLDNIEDAYIWSNNDIFNGASEDLKFTYDEENKIIKYDGLISLIKIPSTSTTDAKITYGRLQYYLDFEGELGVTNYKYFVDSNRLDLQIEKNKNKDIYALQDLIIPNIETGTETYYQVVYSNDGYIIYYYDNDVTNDLLSSDPYIKGRLDNYLDEFKDKTEEITDSTWYEIDIYFYPDVANGKKDF